MVNGAKILRFVLFLPLVWGLCGEGEMPNGTESTLIIHPSGASDLTMGLAASEPYAGSTPYIVPLQTLDFNEEMRWQAVYDQAPPGEGGEAVSEYGPLVPVPFQVVIKEGTRAEMVSAYNDLQGALLNRSGGTIEYKPDGIGIDVLSTFYHYVRSRPPRLLDMPGNRWDAGPKSDGKYTLYVEVEFLTQPIATSDPDNPETISDLTATIQNWVDDSPAQTNHVTIDAADIKGTMPALVRILARPGSGQYLGRLIIFKRDEGTLANFVNIYEAEDASVIYPSAAWTEVADADRGDGAYMRCLPAEDANGYAQGLRFTITNPSDHEGRFAVFGVGYDEADAVGVWTHQAKVVVGNVIQEGADDWEAQSGYGWQLIYAGEFELPPTPLSDSESGYDTGPYIEWYSTRASGTSEFRLDGLLLVYVGDSERQPTALDVQCEDVDDVTNVAGVSNSEELLIENFSDAQGLMRELAHVVAQTDGDFKRALAVAPRGDFVMLDPAVDNMLVFVQEQTGAGLTLLEDDFESYKATRWLLVADMESDETWVEDAAAGGLDSGVSAGADTSHYVEGSRGWKITWPAAWGVPIPENKDGWVKQDVALDLSVDGRFTADDYFVTTRWLSVAASGNFGVEQQPYFHFKDGDSQSLYQYLDHNTAGWKSVVTKRSQMNDDGCDLSDVQLMGFGAILDWATSQPILTVDYVRIEKADPDNAAIPNATGSQWDFQPNAGIWTITEDVSGAGATLACLDVESGIEKSALIDETTPGDVRFRARVMAKRDAGYAGILWRAGNDTLTEGAEDTYAALLDVTNDKLLVREYAAGAITQHANPDFTSAVDTWYVVGVIAKGGVFRVYATAASNLSDDDDVFSSTYLLSTVEDATLTTGKCGVMSISTLGRFDEVKLSSLQDKMIPADEITLSGEAIWRTIAPFGE